MQFTFEGLRMELPNGVAVEFCAGALKLHFTGTGTIICRADVGAELDGGAAGCDALPLPSQLVDFPLCSQPRELPPPQTDGRVAKRSPDSALHPRTAKAVRTHLAQHKLATEPPVAAATGLHGGVCGAPNGPLSPRSDDWAETGVQPGAGALVPAPRTSQPRALDVAWSDMVSGQAPAGPCEPGTAASQPLGSRALTLDTAADTSLGAAVPVAWRWTRLELGPGPAARWGHAGSLVHSEAGASLFVCGGEGEAAGSEGVPQPLADLWRLDLASGAWERKRDAPQGRTWHSCCAAFLSARDSAPTLLLMGGETAPAAGQRGVCADMSAYDTVCDSWFAPWSSGAPPSKRSGHTASLVEGGRMVVFGGAGARKQAEPEVWTIDTKAWKWSRLAVVGKPPFARTYHTATLISGGRLLFFAGNDAERSFGKGKVHVLVLATREWLHPEVSGQLPDARTGHSAVCFGGRHVLVHGGWDYDCDGQQRTFRDDAAILDTETWVWTRVSYAQQAGGEGESAPPPRTGHVAVACGRAAIGSLRSSARGTAAGEGAAAHPALLLHGGMTHDGQVLADSWLLEPVFGDEAA